MAALQANGVCKKFRKGEIFNSLRDLLPALTRRALRSDELADREFWALRDLSFSVERGEALGIIGHNGAGKSTLLKLMSGIMEPTRGTLDVSGRLSALIEVGAGFHPDLTGRENIYLNGTILGMKRAEIRRKFDKIVAFSGLEEFIDTPVKRYSSGMYARLGFSVAAHVEPDILVIDEVLSVGDHLFQRKCLEKMNAVLSGGTTVVFVSHNLRAVASLCPRTILLEQGRAVADGPSREVIRTYTERSAADAQDLHDKDAYISRIDLHGETFEAGQTIRLDVEITAQAPCRKLSVVLDCTDDNAYEIFGTSTERLGQEAFSLDAGEVFECAFELTLSLAPGTYRLGATLHRYEIEKTHDRRLRTFSVTSRQDVQGVAHLQPRVVHYARKSGQPASRSEITVTGSGQEMPNAGSS